MDTIRENEPNVTNRKCKYANIYIYKDKIGFLSYYYNNKIIIIII